MSYYDLHAPIDGFKILPEPSEIFSSDLDLHSKYLLPLATVDLSLNGKVHFISPIEPLDGAVGEGADDYFTYLTRENFIGYKYSGDRCHFDADFRYFQHRRLALAKSLTSEQQQAKKCLDDHYTSVRLGDEKARAHFLNYGMLHLPVAKPPFSPEDRLQIALRLGGKTEGGNWASSPDAFPIDYGQTERPDGGLDFDVAPLTADGRRFVFIGDLPVSTYNWNDTFALSCNLVLYYDPVDKVALTTFDWS